MNGMPEVTQLRLVVTASDYDQALAFYRDVLGLPQRAAYASPSGRVTILEAGHATLELADPPHGRHRCPRPRSTRHDSVVGAVEGWIA